MPGVTRTYKNKNKYSSVLSVSLWQNIFIFTSYKGYRIEFIH